MYTYSNAYAEISTSALKANYNKIKNGLENSEMICVVKADAYGHGAKECTRIFYECGCRFFAVATVLEALQIREAYKDCEIIILGIAPFEAADILSDNNIIAALGSLEQAKFLSENLSAGKKLRCHLKLDTGMNRIGFSSKADDFEAIAEAFCIKGIEIEGMFSHFACADMPESDLTDKQYKRFLETHKRIEQRGFKLKVRHISNSAAALCRKDTHLDYVRCGIILYGLAPSKDVMDNELIPAMTLKTHITHIHTVEKGETVGYGAQFTAPERMKIATLPIGYADGFVRAYAMGGYMTVKGTKCPIVGRICMDQCMIDVSNVDVKTGDCVEVFGPENSVDNLAQAAKTINYESVCLLSQRVLRVYTD